MNHFYNADGSVRWGEVAACCAFWWLVAGLSVGIYAFAVSGWRP